MGLEHVVLGLVGWSAVSVLAAMAWARIAAHARAGLSDAPTIAGELHAAEEAVAPVTADAATLVSEPLADSAWADLGPLQDRIAGRRDARRTAEAGEGRPAVAVSIDADPIHG